MYVIYCSGKPIQGLDKCITKEGRLTWSSACYKNYNLKENQRPSCVTKNYEENTCVSSMIPSARSTVPLVVIIIMLRRLFCFEKWGQTDNTREKIDHYRLGLWVGRVDQNPCMSGSPMS